MRLSAAAGVVLFLAGCGKTESPPTGQIPLPLCDPTLPARPYGYTSADAPLPAHFYNSTAGSVLFVDQTPRDDPVTNAAATLGRVLFYDVRLSANDQVACASCHRQAFGFGDTLRPSPRGPARRTMALANARFNAEGRYFWDERATTLEEQVLQPIVDPHEMAMSPDTLTRKLATTPYYPPLFAAAFGSPEVTRQRIARALAQFVRSLVSSHSRYDGMFATGGAPDTTRLTEGERQGLRLFIGSGCVNCHRTIVQIADQASNIGLDLRPGDSGAGRGRFKPPSLRNVAVRPPYMHDGRFKTLRDVIAFYDHGVRSDPQLDSRLRGPDGAPRHLDLAPAEIDALVAFLNALTDSTFLRAERFSDPFQCRLDPME